MLTPTFIIIMPAKISFFRERESDIEFHVDSPNYIRHNRLGLSRTLLSDRRLGKTA
jgi:hypothetical protein